MSGGARRAKERSERPTFETSSLIDVSFLLLVYFLVTSTLDPREGDLQLVMGGPGTGGQVITFDPPLIEVRPGGEILFSKEQVATGEEGRDLPLLRDRLLTYRESWYVAAQEGTPPVELAVDDSVRGQRFIDVVNCLAGAGISDVTFLDPVRNR